MDKKEIVKEEKTSEENVPEEPKPSRVSLAEVPTQYGLVYRTPEGDMSPEQYLVWLGNMFLDFKEAIAGN